MVETVAYLKAVGKALTTIFIRERAVAYLKAVGNSLTKIFTAQNQAHISTLSLQLIYYNALHPLSLLCYWYVINFDTSISGMPP